MRRIEPTNSFKRDYKREFKGKHKTALAGEFGSEFAELLQQLADDQPLADRLRDHALTGQWSDHRDCHVKPDLVLIYRKPDAETLQLVRIGSHSELGL